MSENKNENEKPFTLDDVFGENPDRPEHPDLWKLSNVLLKMDSGIDPARKTDEENEAAFQHRLREMGVDERSLTYTASQRAFRALGIESREDLLGHPARIDLAMMLTSIWVDAFAAGVFFERGDKP